MTRVKAVVMTRVEAFDNWMRNTIKSIHYSDNEQMIKAYSKFYEENV